MSDSSHHRRVGIVGVSGYGGGEVLRLCVAHPGVDVVYAGGKGSAGRTLGELYPTLDPADPATRLTVSAWSPETDPPSGDLGLDLLFLSLPTGESTRAIRHLPRSLRIVDVGGDHRWADGWTYGLTEVTGTAQIAGAFRVADPGCFSAAALLALAPLVCAGLVDPLGVIVDAKTGVSGAGRGGGATFGFADVNEDVAAYGLQGHPHHPEMRTALSHMAGRPASLIFTPHLIPMTRGILATCYARGTIATEDAMEAARAYYAVSPFVRVTQAPPHSKWAQGTNIAMVSYACDPDAGVVTALGVVDNLGKGAAGQAVQNMNLMLGFDETVGLSSVAMYP